MNENTTKTLMVFVRLKLGGVIVFRVLNKG
jgi:hypothetical protein